MVTVALLSGCSLGSGTGEPPDSPTDEPTFDAAAEGLDLTPLPEMELGEFDAHPTWADAEREPLDSAMFSDDGSTLVTVGQERIHAWDAEDGLARISEMSELGEGFLKVDVSADGTTLATLDMEGTLRLWDVPAGGEPARTEPDIALDPVDMLVSVDGEHVAVTDLAGRLHLVSDGAIETVEAHTGPASLAGFSPDGELLATHGEDLAIRLWDPETGADRGTLTGHTGPVNDTGPVRDTSFSADGTLLASSAGDGTARWWDLEDMGEIGIVEFEGAGPFAVAASSDGGRVAVVEEEEGSPVLDTESGATIARMPGLDRSDSLRFCADDRMMVSVSGASVTLYDSHRGEAVGTLTGGVDGFPGIEFADGLMPVVNRDCTLFVWVSDAPGTGFAMVNSVVPV